MFSMQWLYIKEISKSTLIFFSEFMLTVFYLLLRNIFSEGSWLFPISLQMETLIKEYE